MPKTLGGPLSHDFRYVTVDQLRSEGITAERLPDDRAKNLIVLCSNWINWLTQQWFTPIRLKQKTDGRSSSVFHLPTFVPILDFFSLRIMKENLIDMAMPDISYQVKERYVELLNFQSRLSRQPFMVQLDGVFGWLENDFNYVTTTLQTFAAYGDRTLHVSSNAGIRPGEVVLIGSDPHPQSCSRIVVAVRDNDKIIVEPIENDFVVGSKIVRYGRVPKLIQWATMLLVKDKATPIGIRGTEDDEDSPRWFADRLQNESVEGYSYGLAQLPVQYGFGGGAKTTGNPEVDDILFQFSCPYMYIGSIHS